MARRGTRAESEQRWRERVSRWQGSGQTAAAFAAKEQVSVASLYQWRRRLRGGAGDRPRPRFVPVNVTAARGVLEVVTAGGGVVRVGPGFDAAHLRVVVAALESPAC
jgi:hypothetical protein